MKKHLDYLDDFIKLETEQNLYSFKINNISFWRIIRFKYRIQYLKGANFSNSTKSTTIYPLFISALKSLFQLTLLLLKREKSENIFFSFPRLVNINDSYIDKFTEPVIEFAGINSTIFKRNFGGKNFKARKDINKINIDFIFIFSYALSFLYSPFIFLKHKKQILIFTKKINDILPANKYFIIHSISNHLIQKYIYKFIFRKLKVKNIIVVNREVYLNQIISAKSCKIKVFELQHGITRTSTPNYTGPYDDKIDPDFFLVFGSFWINDKFGVPINKIINIGWAYKNYIDTYINKNNIISEDSILVLSSPEITNEIISCLVNFSKSDFSFKFKLRLHPQESLSYKQSELISKFNNIELDDNTLDSSISIMKHKHIIGVNSSVLFESLSYSKIVGVINTFELPSLSVKEDSELGFEIIESAIQLNLFRNKTSPKIIKQKYYSTFNKTIFNQLLKL